ncbi:MAG: DUF881 domain-containing protein [Proteocatella sp.]
MNKRKLSFEYFILSLLLGILIIIQIESPIQYNIYTSSVSREIVSQINREKSELNDLEKKLNSLNRQYGKFQEMYENENMGLTGEEKDIYYNYRTTVGLEKLSGEGIIVKMESLDTKNIAFDTETNRILLKLVNDIKKVGGEAISINNQRITANSEIILAGNHINVNNVPISQPYEVRAIGNEKTLYRYFIEEDYLLKSLERTLGIKTEITKSRRITIPALSVQKDLEYIKKVE